MNKLIICALYFELQQSLSVYGLNDWTYNKTAPVIETLGYPLNFNTSNEICKNNMELFISSLENNTLWAYKMWESSAKLPLGLIEGSQYQFGNFDECLKIREPFPTQYCLATITFDIDEERIQNLSSPDYEPFMNLYLKFNQTDPNEISRSKLFWGLCLPASCETENAQKELQNYLNESKNPYIKEYMVIIETGNCQNEQHNEHDYTPTDYFFCTIVGVFVTIVLSCTVYEYKYVDYDKINKSNLGSNNTVWVIFYLLPVLDEKIHKLMMCFSAKSNCNELWKPEGNEKTQILYCIKFLSFLSIIFVHSTMNTLIGSLSNYSSIEDMNRSIYSIFFRRVDAGLACYFVIGGLLNTRSFLIQSDKKCYNFMKAIILRYFRFVPSLAVVTFFYSTLFYKMGSGPLWPRIAERERNYCLQNWWTNLLLINNYINVESICVLQSWYLSADFQLFILSIPLNYLLKKNCKISWIIFAAVLGSSISVVFLIVYIEEKEPIFYVHNDFLFYLREVDNFQTVYIPAHTRMSSYLIGMILGFVYYKLKDSEFRISFVRSWIFISLAVIVMVVCMLTGQIFYEKDVPYNALNAALYASLHRPLFAAAIAVSLFCFSFNSINQRLLTWNSMIPLSKLCFGAYLLQFLFQLSKTATQRAPVNFTIFNMVRQSITDTVLSLALAFILFIFIENPCVRFVKTMMWTNSHAER